MNHKIHNVGAAEKIADTAMQSKQRLDCVGFILPGHRAYLTTAPSPKESKPKRALPGNIFLQC